MGRWRGRGQQGRKAGALGSGAADRSGVTQGQGLPLDMQPMSRVLYGTWPSAFGFFSHISVKCALAWAWTQSCRIDRLTPGYLSYPRQLLGK